MLGKIGARFLEKTVAAARRQATTARNSWFSLVGSGLVVGGLFGVALEVEREY